MSSSFHDERILGWNVLAGLIRGLHQCSWFFVTNLRTKSGWLQVILSHIKSYKIMSCVCGYVTSPNTWVDPSAFCMSSDVTVNRNRKKKGAVKCSKNEMCCYIFLNMNACQFLAHHAAVGVLPHYLGLFRLALAVFVHFFKLGFPLSFLKKNPNSMKTVCWFLGGFSTDTFQAMSKMWKYWNYQRQNSIQFDF